jgi:hypothetical protein
MNTIFPKALAVGSDQELHAVMSAEREHPKMP